MLSPLRVHDRAATRPRRHRPRGVTRSQTWALGTVTGTNVDADVFAYTASIRFDWKLYRHDVAGSIGHVRMLAEASWS